MANVFLPRDENPRPAAWNGKDAAIQRQAVCIGIQTKQIDAPVYIDAWLGSAVAGTVFINTADGTSRAGHCAIDAGSARAVVYSRTEQGTVPINTFTFFCTASAGDDFDGSAGWRHACANARGGCAIFYRVRSGVQPEGDKGNVGAAIGTLRRRQRGRRLSAAVAGSLPADGLARTPDCRVCRRHAAHAATAGWAGALAGRPK
jgi:hypothetical protein